MATVELRAVDKIWPDGTHAVRGLDLDARDGELLVLLGPSGCGKSTILRMVAGLEAVTDGEIRIGDRRVEGDPPQDRDVAMVFQSYALYGHMTVRQNLEFPLKMRGTAKAERRARAEEIASLLELDGLLDSRPAALSGGQQQRVAMGRALVRSPKAFLLDEPLSNLDARLRGQVRAHIAEIQSRLGVTTLHVTHDQVEALGLGHRIAVLRAGRLQQVDEGPALYDRPANLFVARFLGQPGMNLLSGTVEEAGPRWVVRLGETTLEVDRVEVVGTAPARHAPVIVGVRPSALRLDSGGEERGLPGEVRSVEELGHERIVRVTVSTPGHDSRIGPGTEPWPDGEGRSDDRPGQSLLAVRMPRGGARPSPDDRVGVLADPARVYLFSTDGSALARPATPPTRR